MLTFCVVQNAYNMNKYTFVDKYKSTNIHIIFQVFET